MGSYVHSFCEGQAGMYGPATTQQHFPCMTQPPLNMAQRNSVLAHAVFHYFESASSFHDVQGHPSGRDVARLHMLIRRMTTFLLGQEADGDSFPGYQESFVLAFEELFAQVGMQMPMQRGADINSRAICHVWSAWTSVQKYIIEDTRRLRPHRAASSRPAESSLALRFRQAPITSWHLSPSA